MMQNLLSPDNTLCFKEKEFSNKSFDVDQFVSKCKDRVPMSTLREDLETHYKNIQLALVELINRDYADFVSLSSNLVWCFCIFILKTINCPFLQFKSCWYFLLIHLSLTLFVISLCSQGSQN